MPLDLQTRTDSKPTVLVVDDFDDTRLLVKTWLEKKGFRVVEAGNGEQAITAAKNYRPDLIIMDLEMPGMDGLEATRKIRTVGDLARVPIVAVSAYGADLFRDEALAAGCDEYLATPCEPEKLEEIIRSLLK